MYNVEIEVRNNDEIKRRMTGYAAAVKKMEFEKNREKRLNAYAEGLTEPNKEEA